MQPQGAIIGTSGPSEVVIRRNERPSIKTGVVMVPVFFMDSIIHFECYGLLVMGGIITYLVNVAFLALIKHHYILF